MAQLHDSLIHPTARVSRGCQMSGVSNDVVRSGILVLGLLTTMTTGLTVSGCGDGSVAAGDLDAGDLQADTVPADAEAIWRHRHCTSGTRSTQSCTIANGTGTQARTCSAGVWSSWGTCSVVSCNAGYAPSGNQCVSATCTGASSQSCSVTNGTGSQSRTCSAGVWSSWGTCSVVSCNTGYVRSGSMCVSSATGTVYTIDPSGSDSSSRDGISSPWRSLAYACSRATSSGATIHVNAGTYPETQVCNSVSKGLADAPALGRLHGPSD